MAAPLGPAALRFDARRGRPLPQPYFVVLGTIEPRKNHLLLLHRPHLLSVLLLGGQMLLRELRMLHMLFGER